MNYTSKNIRNIAILGHLGSGKTTLAESLAYCSGEIKTKGEVEKRNTVSDYLLEEQNRLSSISSSVMSITHNDTKINLIDIPGNDDFIAEVLSVTRLIKGAVIVVDAKAKVEVGTIKHWQILRKRNIPTIIFVNKMDKENIVFDDILNDIKEHLGKKAVPFCYPMGHDDSFDGFVNVVDLKARKYDGSKCVDAEIYDDKKIKVFELHNMICEAVAQTSEEMLDKFFSGEELSRSEIHEGLRQGVLNGDLYPVVLGCATKNIGIHTLLNMFVDYLPTPCDLKPYMALDDLGNEVLRSTIDEEPFSAFVFKTLVDPYAGIISIFKINSGVVKIGDEIYCPQTGKTDKVSNLYTLFGKTQTAVNMLHAGDIGCIAKLSDVRSSMSLCDPKKIAKYKEINYPTAVMFKAINPKNKADEDKLSVALQKIKIEDPTIEIKRNKETKQLLLGGLGLSHISYIVEKMKNIYKVDLEVSDQKIVYRESIRTFGKGSGRYIKQSGGSGFYGVVEMSFEPAQENTFTEKVFGGAVPKNYFPAVEKGFYEALEQGLLAGFPVIGVKATLLDGKYHSVDSNELAFKMAAILAFKEAYLSCNPTILEPIMKVTINVNNRYIGDVLSDINTKRAKVIAMNDLANDNQEIVALIPEAEILDYANELKAITQGGGFFNREFNGFEEVPAYLVDKIIKENKLI